MNTAWISLPAAIAVATLSACGGRTVVVRDAPAPAPVVQQQPVIERVTVVQPPPAPQETQPPAPASGYSWVPGHYEWVDSRWVWQPGQWRAGTIRPMPNPMVESPPSAPPEGRTQWIPGYWRFQGNDWVWINGRWQ